MKQLLIQHAAHLGFVAIGIVAFFWTAYRKPKDAATPAAAMRAAAARAALAPAPEASADRPPTRKISATVARRGLLALGPLLGAVATGAIIYGMNVGGAGLPGAIIWGHVGISILALLLVGYKLAHIGARRLGADLRGRSTGEVLSLALVATSVPLLITGVDLLVVPSTSSFAAYTHLISSVWWTVLLLWHLRRYIAPSIRTVARPSTSAVPSPAVSSPALPVWPPPRPARRRG